MKTFFKYIGLLILALFFQGCFEIIHYLEQKEDSIQISWTFSIPTGMLKNNSMMSPDESGDIFSRTESAEKEFKEKYKDQISNLKIKKIEDEFDTGMSIEFNLKQTGSSENNELKPLDEGFPVVPIYDKNLKKLTFTFLPEKKKRPKPEKVNTQFKDIHYTEVNESNTDNPFESMGGMEEIFSMMFASASYKIILGGQFKPQKIQVISLSSNSEYPLKISKLGNQYMIKVPFMSLFIKEKTGFSVVVHLQ